MSVREIISIPDPVLRQISKPVERIDDALLKLLDDMLDTMYDAPGIGLAGIQIAEPLRIVTMDVALRASDEESADDEEKEPEPPLPNPIFMINPEIVATTDTPNTYEEGCLSIPDYYAEVERPSGCTVEFLDRKGEKQTLEATGILATCIQHEVDHLDGVLFIDYLSKLKRDRVIKKFTKIAKQSGRL